MLELYFSLSSDFLFIALLKEGKCLLSLTKENKRLHSENFLTYLRQILEKCQCSLATVNKVYFTSLPSGQTGLRVSLAFLITLQVLNPAVKIYHINTLLLQAGGDSNCLSLLTIDRRESKFHAAIYQKKVNLLTSSIITKDELGKLRLKFPQFPLCQDFQAVNFLTNFQKLKSDFVWLREIEEIKID